MFFLRESIKHVTLGAVLDAVSFLDDESAGGFILTQALNAYGRLWLEEERERKSFLSGEDR